MDAPESVLRNTTVIPYHGSAYERPKGLSYFQGVIDLANDVLQPQPKPAGAHGPRCMCAKISSALEPLPSSTVSAVAESRPRYGSLPCGAEIFHGAGNVSVCTVRGEEKLTPSVAGRGQLTL